MYTDRGEDSLNVCLLVTTSRPLKHLRLFFGVTLL